jgi:hypothetical protein
MSTTDVSGRFTALPDDETLAATTVALEEHGFSVEVVDGLDADRSGPGSRGRAAMGSRCRRGRRHRCAGDPAAQIRDALMTNIELYGTQVIPRVRELLAGQPVASLAMTKPATADETR